MADTFAIDQYYVQNPDELYDQMPDDLVVDLDNNIILEGNNIHLAVEHADNCQLTCNVPLMKCLCHWMMSSSLVLGYERYVSLN